jgi:hypothetical protein
MARQPKAPATPTDSRSRPRRRRRPDQARKPLTLASPRNGIRPVASTDSRSCRSQTVRELLGGAIDVRGRVLGAATVLSTIRRAVSTRSAPLVATTQADVLGYFPGKPCSRTRTSRENRRTARHRPRCSTTDRPSCWLASAAATPRKFLRRVEESATRAIHRRRRCRVASPSVVLRSTRTTVRVWGATTGATGRMGSPPRTECTAFCVQWRARFCTYSADRLRLDQPIA